MYRYPSWLFRPGVVISWYESDNREDIIDRLDLEDDSGFGRKFLRAEGGLNDLRINEELDSLPSWYTDHQEEYVEKVASILKCWQPIRQKLDALYADYEAKRDPLDDNYDAKLNALYVDYKAKRDALYDDYEAKLNALYADYKARRAPLDNDYKASRALLDNDYEAMRDALDADYKAKRTPLYDDYDTKRDALYDDYEARRDALTKKMSEIPGYV